VLKKEIKTKAEHLKVYYLLYGEKGWLVGGCIMIIRYSLPICPFKRKDGVMS
jgi:hypothetical protein